MVEELGPNLARAIVGDAFDPDFRYELETNDAGMFLVVTNTKDGSSTVQKLQEEQDEVEKFEPIWTEKELPKDLKGSFSTILLLCMLFLLACLLLFLPWG